MSGVAGGVPLLSLNKHGILLKACKTEEKVTNIFGNSKNIFGRNHFFFAEPNPKKGRGNSKLEKVEKV